MKKLLKEYELNSHVQYYEMIVDSIINGQRTQAKELFSAMPKRWRIDCLMWLMIITDENEIHINFISNQDFFILLHLI
jgi:hypothetical protein